MSNYYTFEDTSINDATLTSSTGIEFQENSSNSGTISGVHTGTIMFTGSAVNDGYVGDVSSSLEDVGTDNSPQTVIFSGNSINTGIVGLAEFSGSASNQGSVEEASFVGPDAVNTGTITNAVFLSGAVNNGIVTTAIFDAESINSGTVTLSTEYNPVIPTYILVGGYYEAPLGTGFSGGAIEGSGLGAEIKTLNGFPAANKSLAVGDWTFVTNASGVITSRFFSGSGSAYTAYIDGDGAIYLSGENVSLSAAVAAGAVAYVPSNGFNFDVNASTGYHFVNGVMYDVSNMGIISYYSGWINPTYYVNGISSNLDQYGNNIFYASQQNIGGNIIPAGTYETFGGLFYQGGVPYTGSMSYDEMVDNGYGTLIPSGNSVNRNFSNGVEV